jgi:methylated-DNA-[protein]-cysteine S-methyltransferase
MIRSMIRPPAVLPATSDRTGAGPEVGYALMDSPVGELLLAATGAGLVRLAYLRSGPEPVLAELVDRLGARPAAGRLDRFRRELEEYFAGRRRRFEIPLDWRLTAGMRRRLLEATASIPFGKVATYGEVARLAGRPGAARAAGGAVAANPLAIVIPCHRVVAAGGLGGYGPGLEPKRTLLELEGVLPPALGLAPA